MALQHVAFEIEAECGCPLLDNRAYSYWTSEIKEFPER